MMTRKHFQALADAMAEAKPDNYENNSQDRYYQWRQDCMWIASVCANENPNFDRDRFFDACGVES